MIKFSDFKFEIWNLSNANVALTVEIVFQRHNNDGDRQTAHAVQSRNVFCHRFLCTREKKGPRSFD